MEDTNQERVQVGEKLLAARKAANMSLRELAAETGIDHSNIAKIEKAEIDPQLSTLILLAKGLRILPSALLDGLG